MINNSPQPIRPLDQALLLANFCSFVVGMLLIARVAMPGLWRDGPPTQSFILIALAMLLARPMVAGR